MQKYCFDDLNDHFDALGSPVDDYSTHIDSNWMNANNYHCCNRGNRGTDNYNRNIRSNRDNRYANCCNTRDRSTMGHKTKDHKNQKNYSTKDRISKDDNSIWTNNAHTLGNNIDRSNTGSSISTKHRQHNKCLHQPDR